MTEKRFNKVGGYVYDGDKCISHFEDVAHRDDIVKLLNELHEENQDLKAFNQDLSEELLVCANARISKDNRIERLEEKIQRERNSFRKTQERWSKEAETKIKELADENDQLKYENGWLKSIHFANDVLKENKELKQSNERLLKMLDNVANYMQRDNKYMPIDDFVEWWNNIATKGLDDGDVE